MTRRRATLLLIDMFCYAVACGFMLGVFPTAVESLTLSQRFIHSALVIVCIFSSRIIFKSYGLIWRYAQSTEYLRMMFADAVGAVVYLMINMVFMPAQVSFMRVVAVIALGCLATLGSRLAYQFYMERRYRRHAKLAMPDRINVAIVGAGQIGMLLAEELLHNRKSRYTPVCFVDIDRNKVGGMILGVPVIAEDDTTFQRFKEMHVQEIVIALQNLSAVEMKRVYELYIKAGCTVKLYDVPNMTAPGDQKRRMRDFRIEDLLFRDIKSFSGDAVRAYYQDKVVMITGGGGSIGSELCRQVAKMSPRELIILDIYENNAYDICQELTIAYGGKLNLSIEIASVRDAKHIDSLMDAYHPDVVIHAAAHKHVHLMEKNCTEAIKNNVLGTFNVANAAEKYGVKRFILISTDKAVNPTNVMGASKRICEMIIESRKDSATSFAAVRFGNVLGSNGSIIPLFKRQIENGGPLTLTDKRIVRYFMTIPEASQLVLEASVMADKADIFVLDMGEPVKILKLAEDMIRLTGYEPYKDIDIVEIGLRPGEKLYEELLIKSEDLGKTENAMIFVEHPGSHTREEVARNLERLCEAVATEDNQKIKEMMMQIVPTYRTPEEVNAKAAYAEEMQQAENKGKVLVEA